MVSTFTRSARVAPKFLSNDDLRSIAPTIFAERPADRVSDRYQYIPTARIVDGLRDAGFAPVKVTATRVRDEARQGYQKHMIRFRSISGADMLQVGDTLPEVVLVNSHDGTSSYQLSAGLFRLACLNGLVVQSGQGEEIRISHNTRNIVDAVVDGSHKVLTFAGKALEHASRWQGIKLEQREQMALAVGAHALRFGEDPAAAAIAPEKLLRARRSADLGNDLWTTFNVIQENTIRGGLRGVAQDPETGRRRNVSTREVKGIDGNLSLNRALWAMASYLEANRGK